MKITKQWLAENGACQYGRDWAVGVIGDGMSVQDMLQLFDQADWMLWLLWHSRTVSIRQLAWLSCVVGRTSLVYVPKGEDRPRLAYEAAEAYLLNPSTTTRDAAGAAGDAAGAAGAAAGDAAGAAWDAAGAAWAARAAARAAWAAAEAAGDATGAARAAAWAAWDAAAWAAGAATQAAARAARDAARVAAHKKMCILILAEMDKPSFAALAGQIDAVAST